MRRQWYVRKGDKVSGPFADAELKSLAKRGKVSPNNQLRVGEGGPWQPASEIPGLFPWIDEVSAPAPQEPRPKPQSQGPSRWLIAAAVGVAAMISLAAVAIVCVFVFWPTGADEPAEPAGPKSGIPRLAKGPAIDDWQPALPEPAVRPAMPDLPEQPVEPVVRIEPEPQPQDDPQHPAPAPKPALPVVEIDPKPILPPIPDEKTEISDSEIRDFDKALRLELKATDAYARYNVFAQSYLFTKEQQERVDVELAAWKQRADEDLYRLGSDWVAKQDVEEAEQQAEMLIARARALIEVGNIDACLEVLEDANRANPNGIKAPYLLGLIWSLPVAGLNGPDNAEKYFRTVLLRQPDHVGALNSIAIAQIKQGEHFPALNNLERSAQLSEACPEVTQNLGRFIFLAGIERIRASDTVINRYSDVYSQLVAEKKGPASQQTVGWLHMVPIFPENERNEPEPEQPKIAAGGDRLIPRFSGTGFVVAPNYIMTNRHVVYDEEGLGVADAVGITDPGDEANELQGVVVAISDTTDLALVYVDGLNAQPLILRGDQVGLATEVMTLGYPQGHVFGVGLKATRGVISALPDASRPVGGDYYLFDAIADHGNSGGPVLDRNGLVLGVLTIAFGDQAHVALGISADFTGGVPSPLALEFARQEIVDFEEQQAAAEAYGDWAEVTAGTSPSVRRLTVYYKAGIPELRADGRQLAGVQANVYEDATCPTCNGRRRLNCTERGCIRGEVSIKYFQTAVVGVGANRKVARIPKYRKEKCPRCNGASTLDCPDCRAGYDSYLH